MKTVWTILILVMAGGVWGDTGVARDSCTGSSNQAGIIEGANPDWQGPNLSDLRIGKGNTAPDWEFAVRIDSIDVVQAATVDSALWIINSRFSSTSEIVMVHVKCELAANAAVFTDSTEYVNRTWTAAVKDTTIAPWGTDTWDTIDIKGPVQEVINQGGWAARNAIVVRAYRHTGSTVTSTRGVDNQYVGGADEAPKLVVFWSTPAATQTKVIGGAVLGAGVF